MKVYSIGREAGCDIVINDNTDVISRRHAILNVSPSGKMTIVDQSHNGTYVNGIRISPNVPVPVTRKDNISFAHVARLDWNRVPKAISPMRYAIYGFILLSVIVGAVFGYKSLSNGEDNKPKAEVTAADSTILKKQEQDKADSVKKREEKKKTAADKPADTKKAKGDTTKQSKTNKKETKEVKQQQKKCPTCKKDVKDCEYKGNHPKSTRADR